MKERGLKPATTSDFTCPEILISPVSKLVAGFSPRSFPTNIATSVRDPGGESRSESPLTWLAQRERSQEAARRPFRPERDGPRMRALERLSGGKSHGPALW